VGVLDASTSPPTERYAVSKDNIIHLIQPTNVDDQLTEILRTGARALLAQAVEAEVADFLGKHADLKTADGHQRVVRHGHLPERDVVDICTSSALMRTTCWCGRLDQTLAR
jgi:putative transposase